MNQNVNKARQITMGKHLYLEDLDSIVACDTSSAFDRNFKKMLSELSKQNPKTDVLDELMAQTYSCRGKYSDWTVTCFRYFR